MPHRKTMPAHSIETDEIFATALELPLDERAAYVRMACGDNAELRNEVTRLLDCHQRNQESEFILDRAPVTPADNTADAAIAEQAGDIIGRYRLLERIGEGGMGVVYMAEQVEGVRRRVALKIIKLGMDTRHVIARFEAERQAMAMFDHPNITKVFDAGATNTGRPYFVMELVQGTNIADYVKRRGLSLPQRLRLFADVCLAVQHAHQKGIIHRDLKPSNILVTHFDGVPAPKVIDFGIAKAIGQQGLTDKTLFTRYSAMVGTPQYMSPEQAEMTGIDIDTRSDIYSLGVLLYELVTGSTPLSGSYLKTLNPAALCETLRDVAIETPSARLAKTIGESDDDSSETIADFRVRSGNELDWVTLKALSRDRTERYASANEFAADIDRYLNNDPVLAAPPSKTYKIKAYLRKHRTAVTSAVLITTALLISTIACSLFAIRSQQANNQLSIANAQLMENIQQLEAAEQRLRDTDNERQYDAANQIALAKFDMQFESEITKIATRLFPLPNGQEGHAGCGLCGEIDQSTLLDMSLAGELDEAVQRLRKTIERELNFLDLLYPEPNDGDDPPEHTPDCRLLQVHIDRHIPKHRPAFYRILVQEYRRAFGEDDSRVADGLQLLAASLIDEELFDEAEAHLREATAITKGDENQSVKRSQISASLLQEIQRRRK